VAFLELAVARDEIERSTMILRVASVVDDKEGVLVDGAVLQRDPVLVEDCGHVLLCQVLL